MKLSALLAPLIASKASHATIMDVVLAYEAEQAATVDEGKEKARERWRRWKAKQPETNVGKRLSTLANDSHAGVTRVEDNLLPKKISGQKENKKERAPAARRVAADEFKAELTAILDDERIEALCAVRRKKGATFTAHAGRLLSKALSACPDPHAAADEMVLRNWTGIKPEWLESKTQRATSPPRRDTYVDAMHRILEGRANGTENIFGTDGDAQRISADGKRQGTNVADIRGGLARRIIQGSG